MRPQALLRSLATFVAAVAVATCTDGPSASPTPAPSPGPGRLMIAPAFSRAAAAVYASRNLFAGLTFDHVRVVLVRPPSETVLDTTIVFGPDSPPVTLELNVKVKTAHETFKATIDYVNIGAPMFHGEGNVQSFAPDEPVPLPQPLVVQYVGVGANATRLVVSPKTTSVRAPAGANFSATAFDANNAAIPGVPISWTSSDPSVATIGADGVLATTGKRGTVTITARTPTSLSDNASLTVTLPPTAINVVSGSGQSGKAGSTLAQLAVVRVVASDSVGVPGVTVNFAGPVGGAVSAPSVVTDTNGIASSGLTLGGTAGLQAFAAVAGSFSTSIAATATPADPAAIASVSGGGQQDTVRKTLKNPLVVKVTDRFGNAVPGVSVAWSRTAGFGSLGASSSTTGEDGTASVAYTLGATVGPESVSASVAGAANPATFTMTALSSGPAAIVAVSGNGQAGRVLTAFPSPFVVKVTDVAGSPVSGASVSWTATGGTIGASTTTDAQGQSSNTATGGSALGSITVTATVATLAGPKSVSFAGTVGPGVVAKLSTRVGPPASVTAGVAIAPAIQFELQDAAGNKTPAVNEVTIALGANPGSSTLGGTLTRAAVNGVATFDDLKLDKIGTGYTLLVTSAGVPPLSTGQFAVTQTTSSTIVIVAGDKQTATVNSPVPVAPSVKAQDAAGAPAAGVVVTFAPLGGSGTATPTTVTTNDVGVATLTSWTLGQTAGAQIMIASVPGSEGVTFHATARAGPAVKLGISTAPPASATSGAPLSPQPVIQVQDQFGNPVAPDEAVTVTATASGTTVTATGTSASTSPAGVATFSALTLSGTGSTSLTFNASGLTPVTSAAITFGAVAPRVLAITTQPSATAQSGVAFAAQPVVQLRDASGNSVAQTGVSVTATIVSGSGTLGGTVSATTNALGVASFTDLKINGVVGAFTLAFSATSATNATSAQIALSAGTASALAFVQQPSVSQATSAITPAITVAVKDADGNTVTSATNSITVALVTGTGTTGAVLSGTLTAAAVNGVATFSGLSVDRQGANYRMSAAATGFTTISSAPFSVGIAPGGTLTILSGNPQVIPSNYSGTDGGFVVIVKDGSGNPIAGVPVTFTPTAPGLVSSSPTPVVSLTNAAGTATAFTSLPNDNTVQTVTFTAAITAIPPVTLTLQRMVSNDYETSCALTTTGAPYCWGDNVFGTVGDGTTTNRNAPTAVLGGVTLSSLAAAWSSHQCGLTSGGQAYCWGRNSFGELGDNTTTNRSQAVAVQGGLAFASIYTSTYSTCGITTSGQTYCWGWLAGGFLGDGDRGTLRSAPALVNTGGKTFTKLAMSEQFVCGMESTGALSCWGFAPDGTHVTATPFAGLPLITDVAAGSGQVCAIANTGAAWCWSNSLSQFTNQQGQLGDNTFTPRTTPAPVVGTQTFVELRIAGNTSCGRTAANTLYCWGSGGTIGDGNFSPDRAVPTQVFTGHAFAKFTAGGFNHVCAATTLGQPFCWGFNGVGQLGTGNSTSFPSPFPVKWVEGAPGVPRSVLVNAGNNVSGAPGVAVTPLPSVIVRDFANNPVVGASVTFAVTAGGGTITGENAVTNASGVATVGSWTRGASPGTNTLTATVTGVAQVTFTSVGTGGAPSLIVSSINQTICNPTCTSTPVNLNAALGQIDVTLNIQSNGQALQSVAVVLSCPGPTSINSTQQVSGTGGGPVTLSLNTANYSTFNGVPFVRNGACTLNSSVTSAGGTTTVPTNLTLANVDGVVLSNVFAPVVNAEGLSGGTSAVDGNSMTWRGGAPTVTALPVLYSGRKPATVFITLPGAAVPTQGVLYSTAINNGVSATWSATATAPASPNVTGMTIVNTTGCTGGAVPPACGALESNNITPKGVAPSVTVLDTDGATISLIVLNPGTTASEMRIDNTPPQAPLAFQIQSIRNGWAGTTYAFATTGVGLNNANLTAGSTNFVSCGDGPDVVANPYLCRSQIGVSASPSGQIGVGNNATNGFTSFTYYARPAAGYTPVNTSKGTSTLLSECDITAWTKITNAGQLSATLTNNAYVVRVFEHDRLNNVRCTDLAVPVTAASGLGTIINTGTGFSAANQGRFGVDAVPPSIAFVDPSTDATAAGAFQAITSTTLPSFKIAVSDNESGLRPVPLIGVMLKRLAIDPSTGVAATTTSPFGCPIGFNTTTLACTTFFAGPAALVVDASSAANASSGIEGYYTYSGFVDDVALNVSPTLTRTVLVDHTAPTVESITVPSSLVGGSAASFATIARDNLDLASSTSRLTYPLTAAGAPSPFVAEATGPTLGVAFSNVLTTVRSFSVITPAFIRNIVATNSSGAPQAGGVAPTQIAVRVFDAAGNLGTSSASIPAASINSTNITDYTAAQSGGATLQTFQVTVAPSNVSNCSAAGCAGGTSPANPTSLTLTAAATASQAAAGPPYQNLFVSVSFYYLDASGVWVLLGTTTNPTVTDNGAQTLRTFTWSIPGFDPPLSLGSGATLKLLAVAVNANGDGLLSPLNANVFLTNP